MNKKFLILILSLIILAGSASAVSFLDLMSVTSPSSDPGSSVTFSLRVNNTANKGHTNLSVITLTSSSLTSGGNTISAPGISSIASLNNGVVTTRNFTLTIPAKPSGTYTGTITGSENATNNDTIAYTLTVNAKGRLSITTYTETNPLILTANVGDTASGSFSITNDGSVTLTGINIPDFSISDNDGDNTSIVFTGEPSSLGPGSSATISVAASIDEDMDLDTYSSIITVNDTSWPDANDTLKLQVRVQPEICEDGIRSDGISGGNNLDVDVRDPDTGDDFYPGDEIDVSVKVKNNDNDDMDVVVEAILYNVDENDEVASVKSDETEITDGDSETFDLTLEVPTSDLDPDDDYIIYVKAYQDGDEDENCNEDSVSIDIDRKDNHVAITKFTISPSTATCGSIIELKADVENLGKKDDDSVTIRFLETALKLDWTSQEYDLSKYSKSDNDAIIRYNFAVPSDATAGEHSVEASLSYDDGDESDSEFKSLTLTACDGTTTTTTTTTGGATYTANIDQGSQTVSLAQGDKLVFTVSGELHNLVVDSVGTTSATITISSSPVTFSLNTGETRNFDLNADSKNDITVILSSISDGKASLSVSKYGSGVSSITGAANAIKDWFSGSKTFFWIIGDIVLIVLAIFFIKLIFGGRKDVIEEESIE